MARPMKYCPNYQCAAYGRVVYSQATRCAFCRWDLKPPRLKSEMTRDLPKAPAEPAEVSASDPVTADRRPPALRRTA
jgi:hypothetical protein